MRVVIRPYVAKDKADVIRLLIDLQDHLAKLDTWGRLRARGEFDGSAYLAIILKSLKRRDKIFVAVHKGKVVGMIQAVGPHREAMSTLERRQGRKAGGSVAQLIVDQRARGLGVGKALVRAAEVFLRTQGCDVVYIACFATNTHSLEFYRSQGYIERSIEFAKRI